MPKPDTVPVVPGPFLAIISRILSFSRRCPSLRKVLRLIKNRKGACRLLDGIPMCPFARMFALTSRPVGVSLLEWKKESVVLVTSSSPSGSLTSIHRISHADGTAMNPFHLKETI